MIKITTGFREDQFHTIPDEEAHKAYYLFLNTEKRGIFNNGVALLGADIRSIEPDYHATMGWNPTYELTNDDWNEIRGRNVDKHLKRVLYQAQAVARLENPPIDKPLSEAIKLLPKRNDELDAGTSSLADKMRIK